MELINKLPKMKYASSSQENCSLCLSKFIKAEKIRKLPCNHIFHDQCAISWIINCEKDNICPKCKNQILNLDNGIKIE